jgi:glycosyltransferase involved in cell wall biosynthesis
MGDPPTVGLALIARDEARTLPRLLASCDGAFDEVVLVDTGSTDATVACFEAWARTQARTRGRVEHFAWIDDFAAARNAAQGTLGTDWVAWADCDDEIVGAGELRGLAAAAPDDVAAYSLAYDYDGSGSHTLRRERLVRAGHGRWAGRIHEVQDVQGTIAPIERDRIRWRHHGDSGSDEHLGGTPRAERDLRILRAEVREDPYDRRAAFYLAQTLADLGRGEAAIAAYERRIELGGWEEEVFYSRFRAGVLRADGGDWPGGLAALIDAWESRPARLEPVHEIVWRLRVRNQHRTALAFLGPVLDAAAPDDQLFVHAWVYDWGLRFEHTIVGYWAGDVEGALESCDLLLRRDDLPEEHRLHVAANRAFCIERLERERAAAR